MKKAEEITARLEATIEVAVARAIDDFKDVDIEDVADALYKRLDDQLAGQILLRVKQ